MKQRRSRLVFAPVFLLATALCGRADAAAVNRPRVKVQGGMLEGSIEASGVRSFKGVPFAAPPVGALRWQPPRPPAPWKGVRKADAFGPRCMQRAVFGDMNFRSNGMGEDCLYLNVWLPPVASKKRLPVLVYFYGGGFIAGDGSEPRYEGESMAQKGIIAITMNYRLGPFGFLAHPELSKESPHHASGNYAFLDQQAALVWVQKNIAAMGGDPKRVTIAGESAGSLSVSAQMASPLSKKLIAGAIGESGAILETLAAVPLAEGEKMGVAFAAGLGLGETPSLATLRGLSAEVLLEATAKKDLPRFSPVIDGYFFPKSPTEIYTAGEQARVPLLAGTNSAESGPGGVLGREKPTVENYRKALQRLYTDKADAVFKLYPATNEEEVLIAARDLASDRFLSYGTWKWVDLCTRSGGKPTYYYYYDRARPAMRAEMGDAAPGLAGGVLRGAAAAAAPKTTVRGASHSAEIEYAMGNLNSNLVYAWTPEDHAISKTMQEYFANFIKTGNPNGPGLPDWPLFSTHQRLVIDVNTRAENEGVRERYEFLEQISRAK